MNGSCEDFVLNIITKDITLVFVSWHLVSSAWFLGCWTPSHWVVHPAWLTWTKSTLTVSTPAWPSRTSHPKSPPTPSFRTWLVPTQLPASSPAQRLSSTSIPPVPTPVKAWVWAVHPSSIPNCLACTAAWSPCPSRWAYPPAQGLSQLRCITRRRGVREPGGLGAEHPSTSQIGKSLKYPMSLVSKSLSISVIVLVISVCCCLPLKKIRLQDYLNKHQREIRWQI